MNRSEDREKMNTQYSTRNNQSTGKKIINEAETGNRRPKTESTPFILSRVEESPLP